MYLFYPIYCVACNESAPANQQIFCTHCLTQLPFTNHLENQDNLLALRFKGRQNVEFSGALFEMHKKGIIAKMIYAIKYGGRKDIAFELGKHLAKQLVDQNKILDWDYLVTVPLHKRKIKKRGYNQSEEFAKGMQSELNIPILGDSLIKRNHTDSQTQRNRQERISNVFDSIEVQHKTNLNGKHLLLVDDVVTTGATLDACMIKLNEFQDVRFSIAIIALAKH